MIKDYLSYFFKAKDEHALHSPFVFDFYTKILKNKPESPHFFAIENLKNELLKNNQIIEIQDFGAGSKINKSNQRKIASIAQNTSKPTKFGKLFFRIIQHFQYKTILDLGTSLGITTSFLASANAESQVISFEGCPKTAEIAQENFKKLNLKNIELLVGNIDESLQKRLDSINQLDFVFFDANHQYQPTINYFEWCLQKKHEGSCFIFDDIYWSDGMKKAWNYIKNHSETTITIDLFWIGIVFFRKKQPKQHFVLKF